MFAHRIYSLFLDHSKYYDEKNEKQKQMLILYILFFFFLELLFHT